jgi:hypothetical protein
MIGALGSIDTSSRTSNIDMIYVDDEREGGNSFNIGGASIQRLGHYNKAFRINHFHKGNETSKARSGTIYSAEVFWTPYKSDDIAYVNTYYLDGRYTQAGREPVDKTAVRRIRGFIRVS